MTGCPLANSPCHPPTPSSHLHPGPGSVLPEAKVSGLLYMVDPSLRGTRFLVSSDVRRSYTQGLTLREMLATWILSMALWLWASDAATSTTPGE